MREGTCWHGDMGRKRGHEDQRTRGPERGREEVQRCKSERSSCAKVQKLKPGKG